MLKLTKHMQYILVSSFIMFTPTTILYDSIKDCLDLEIRQNNDPGFFLIHQENLLP